MSTLYIPDGVAEIGDWAFRCCFELLSVTIPDSVSAIGEYAFEDCDSLSSVSIGGGISEIGEHAFGKCEKLKSVSIKKPKAYVQSMANYKWYLPSGCVITCTDGTITIP